jgi:hypothetical protein
LAKDNEMIKNILFFVCVISCKSFAQKVTKSYDLSLLLNETSGLEITGNRFVTLNDSGGDPVLYYLNNKGEIIQKRLLQGQVNIDWEDITKDKTYLYIADTGNNYDTRKNLNIIKVPINSKSSEPTRLIHFSYPEQKDFNYKLKSRFDAEALISIGENLLIFTKNRATKTTQIYKLPKTPGTYKAEKIGELNTQSIITGADYHEATKTLAMTATIDFNTYYLLTLKNFSLTPKLDYNINMYEIPIGDCQVEAIKILSPNRFWLTSEDEKSDGYARFFKVVL